MMRKAIPHENIKSRINDVLVIFKTKLTVDIPTTIDTRYRYIRSNINKSGL